MKNLGNNVFYIGTDDLTTDLFESQYIIPEGISYNSYLIMDEKVAVMDTVDAAGAEAWKANLQEALGDRHPDYLVVHHMEPDHSALVAWVLEKWQDVKLVASAKAVQMLPQYFEGINTENRVVIVKEGDALSLGTHKITFYSAPMVHWPEVMVSFDESDGTLYSADGFGKFGALCKCGFYGRDDNDWSCEARRYYFNIVGKYGVQVQSLLKKAATLPIKTIRPLHGPILEDNLGEYIGLYDVWSRYEPETDGVFIAVASIHGNTMKTAKQLREMLLAKGVKVSLSDLCRSDFAENVEDAFKYSRMVLAASTYDAGIFTPMSDFLHLLKVKGYSKRRVGLIENGSWAPCAAKMMREQLESMKSIEIVGEAVTIRGAFKTTDIPSLKHLADNI